MNTLKTIALSCSIVIGILNSSAATMNKNIFSGNDNIKKQIQKEISFPEFLKGKKQKNEVKVSFTVDANGKAVIVTINTEDAELKKYVQQKMETMKFAADENESEVHNMNLVFKQI